MNVLEIVIGAALLLISILTMIVCMMQEQTAECNGCPDRCKQRFLL